MFLKYNLSNINISYITIDLKKRSINKQVLGFFQKFLNETHVLPHKLENYLTR
jgi:hypothetical protein